MEADGGGEWGLAPNQLLGRSPLPGGGVPQAWPKEKRPQCATGVEGSRDLVGELLEQAGAELEGGGALVHELVDLWGRGGAGPSTADIRERWGPGGGEMRGGSPTADTVVGQKISEQPQQRE